MIESAVGLDASHALPISAKTGQGVPEVLEAIVKRVPPPKGRAGEPAPGADFRFLVRSLSWRRSAGARHAGHDEKGQQIRLMSNGRSFEVENARRADAEAGGSRRALGRRSRLPDRQHQERCRHQDRRHHHRRRSSCDRAAARIRRVEADGVRRALHGRCARAHVAARCAGKAAAERFVILLRTGKLGGAGLRLPLRIPRAAAHGDHPGAAGARIQSRPDHHCSQRALPDHEDRWTVDRRRQSFALARPQRDRQDRRTGDPGDDSDQRRICRRNPEIGGGQARQAEEL